MNNKTHTPLFHVVKRGVLPWYKVWAIRGAGLLLAILVCGLITTLVTKQNPLEVYAAIVNGSFGSPRKIWILLQNIAMLLCVSLAVTPAFRMRCWNLGAEGQALIGGLAVHFGRRSVPRIVEVERRTGSYSYSCILQRIAKRIGL